LAQFTELRTEAGHAAVVCNGHHCQSLVATWTPLGRCMRLELPQLPSNLDMCYTNDTEARDIRQK
jgi:hypothetical protein